MTVESWGADDPGLGGQGRVETYAPLTARTDSLSLSFLSVWLMKRCSFDAATAAGLFFLPGSVWNHSPVGVHTGSFSVCWCFHRSDIIFTPGCKKKNPTKPAGGLSHFEVSLSGNTMRSGFAPCQAFLCNNSTWWPNNIFLSNLPLKLQCFLFP